MKIKLLIFSLLLSGLSWGQSIFTNSITGTNPNTSNPYITGQTIDANITVSGIGRGTGITGANANNRYSANAWSTGAIDSNDYFEFTLTPNSGYKIDFTNFVYTGQVSTGTPSFAFRSSIDGFTSNIGTPTTGGTTISLAAGAYQGISSVVKFRFYVFGVTAGTTTYSINDFTFNGSVTSLCTPPTISTVYPISGPKGTEVTITASAGNLSGATATFGGVAAIPVSSSSTQLVVKVPTGAITGSLVVTNAVSCQATTTFTVIDKVTSSCEGTVINDLIIYEVYDENGGSGGTITLFNGTTVTKTLSNYRIFRTGSQNDGNEVNYGALTGSIAPGALGIIKVAGSSCGPAANNGAITGGFNDNDGLQLRASDLITVIDDVDVPNRVGYYMKRDLDAFIPRTSYVAADWTTVDVDPGDCIAGLGITTPVVAAAANPSITAEPAINLTCSSINATLTVTATEGFPGGLPLTYQWYAVAPNTAAWTTISGGIYSGESTNSLNISSLTGLEGYQYYCQVRENGAACYQATIAVKIIPGFSTTWDGTTWSNGTPDLTKLAVINGNFTTSAVGNGNITACSLLVNSPFTATITDGMYFNIQNNVTVNAGAVLNIQNNGSLIQVNDTGVNTGNIFMKRTATIRLLDYVYWSSPVAGFAVTTISPTTSLSKIWKWNPSAVNPNGGFGNWQNANETMSIGKGYIVRGPNGFNATPQAFTANFVGIPNNGIKNVTIERGNFTGADYPGTNGASITKNDDNWNLIGNPYPSAISAVDFLALNANIEGSVRVWTHGTLPSNAATSPFYNTYTYNYSASDYIVYNATGPSTQNGFDGYIGAGQSFFVLMNDGPATTETVTFQNALRNKGQRNDQFFRNAHLQNTTNSIERHRIWIDLVSATGNVNRALVGYVEGATQNKDRLYDANSDRKSAQDFYSVINNEPMVIQGRALPFSTDDLVPMGVKLPTNGTYTIALATVDGLFSNNAQTIYLEDKVLNVIHNLSNAPYQFTANQGVVNNRFVLRYTNATLSNHDFETAENNVAVSTVNNDIKVSSSLENIKELSVYNVLGQVLATKKNVNANQVVVNSIVRSQQALIVKVTLENGQTSTRKIIF